MPTRHPIARRRTHRLARVVEAAGKLGPTPRLTAAKKCETERRAEFDRANAALTAATTFRRGAAPVSALELDTLTGTRAEAEQAWWAAQRDVSEARKEIAETAQDALEETKADAIASLVDVTKNMLTLTAALSSGLAAFEQARMPPPRWISVAKPLSGLAAAWDHYLRLHGVSK